MGTDGTFGIGSTKMCQTVILCYYLPIDYMELQWHKILKFLLELRICSRKILYSTHSRTITKNCNGPGILSGSVAFLRVFFSRICKIAKCNSPGVTTVHNKK